MSFLDESSATLQEALAFIDACEASSSSAVKPKTDYWQRLREERKRLRQEATTLEATLESLHAKRLAAKSVHRTLLKQEYFRRRRAETTNQQLRALVAKNRRALNALAMLSSAACENLSAVMPVLASRLNRLEIDAMEILGRVGLLRTESFLLRTQHETHAALGSVIETISSVPLLINTQQADLSLWRRVMHNLGVEQEQSGLCPCIEGGFAKAPPTSFAFKGEQFKVTTNMTSRRHVRGESVLYVWAAETPIPGKNVSFIEEGVICARDSTPGDASQRTAVVQYWYRIHAEETGTLSPGNVSIELERMKESGLRWRSTISMGYLQSLEIMLMDETEANASDARVSVVAA